MCGIVQPKPALSTYSLQLVVTLRTENQRYPLVVMTALSAPNQRFPLVLIAALSIQSYFYPVSGLVRITTVAETWTDERGRLVYQVGSPA